MSSEVKPWTCDYCGKTSRSRDLPRGWFKVVNDPEHRHICPACARPKFRAADRFIRNFV